MKASEIMIRPCVTVLDSSPLPEVAARMQALDIGSVVVVDSAGNAVGLITEGDFTGVGRCVPFSLKLAPVIFGARAGTFEELKKIYESAAKLTARQVMSPGIQGVSPDTEIGRVVQIMNEHKRNHVPVLEGTKPVGMVARHDLLRLLMPNMGRG